MRRDATAIETKAPRARERDFELLELWLSGGSLRSIASLPQVTESRATVGRCIQRALAALAHEQREQAENMGAAHAARLDRLILALWTDALGNAQGRPPSIAAAREIRRLTELRARIDGSLRPETEEDGFAAELARLAESQGEAVVQVLLVVLGSPELGLDAEKQDAARRLAGRTLRQITA